jgi:hypothetical protein
MLRPSVLHFSSKLYAKKCAAVLSRAEAVAPADDSQEKYCFSLSSFIISGLAQFGK